MKIQLSNIPNSGNGLFVDRPYKKGEIICDYYGSKHTRKSSLQIVDKSYLMRLGPDRYIDGKDSDCMAKYINDIRNDGKYNVCFIKLPKLGIAQVVALVDIQVGEELYVDYGKMYWIAYNIGKKKQDRIYKT